MLGAASGASLPGGDHPGLRLGRPDGRDRDRHPPASSAQWGVNGLKHMLGADDAPRRVRVHGVGGIVGAILTGVFAAPSLGGTGAEDFDRLAGGDPDLSVLVTIVWSAVVAFVAYKVADLLVGCACRKTRSVGASTPRRTARPPTATEPACGTVLSGSDPLAAPFSGRRFSWRAPMEAIGRNALPAFAQRKPASGTDTALPFDPPHDEIRESSSNPPRGNAPCVTRSPLPPAFPRCTSLPVDSMPAPGRPACRDDTHHEPRRSLRNTQDLFPDL